MPYDELGKKKKKGKFSFLASLASLGTNKTPKNKDKDIWKNKGGSYFEGSKSKNKKLDAIFEGL